MENIRVLTFSEACGDHLRGPPGPAYHFRNLYVLEANSYVDTLHNIEKHMLQYRGN